MTSLRNTVIILLVTVLVSACDGETRRSIRKGRDMKVEDYANGLKRSVFIEKAIKPRLLKKLLAKGLSWGAPVFIRILKEERLLELWMKRGETFKLYETYSIAAMSGVLGPKTKEGDKQAPEGFYYVTKNSMKPDSSYHLAFNIGYPNTYDRVHHRTGSFIMVHGGSASIGCYAMTDEMIEEIYTLCSVALKNGQSFFRVHSFPFRFSEKRMKASSSSEWYEFWRNLEQGYEIFEKTGSPPDVSVKNGRYEFSPM